MLIRSAGGDSWEPAATTGYTNEDALQALVAETPSLLPGIEDAVAVRELKLGTGPADVVCVDSSGLITLVEVKLSRNSGVRREVLAQLFDYAAGLWRLEYDAFNARWHQRAGTSLADSIAAAAEADFDADEFRTAVSDALSSGAFNLVIVVDRIRDELVNIVDYVNLQATGGLDVSLLELRYVRHHDTEIIVPRLHGPRQTPSAAPGSTWTLDRAITELTALADPPTRLLLTQIIDHGRAFEAIHHGRGRTPSVSGYATVHGRWKSLWALKVRGDRVNMKINRKSLRSAAGDDAVTTLDQAMGDLPALAEAVHGIDQWPDNRNVYVDLAELDIDTMTKLLQAMYAEADGPSAATEPGPTEA